MKKAFESAATLTKAGRDWKCKPNSRPIITEKDGGCNMLYAEKTTYRDYLIRAIRELLKETKDENMLYLIREMLMRSLNK